MIHRREMKSRSKVTKRQKVRRTSEMALRFSRGGGMRCDERLWLWDSEVPREARAGRLRSKSQASSPGSLLILVGPHVEVGTMWPQGQGWGEEVSGCQGPGDPRNTTPFHTTPRDPVYFTPYLGPPVLHQGPQLCSNPLMNRAPQDGKT